MSNENVEAFKCGLEAGNRGDVDGLLDELHPEIEWHSALRALMGAQQTVFRGHAGVRRMMETSTTPSPKFASRCRSSETWETGSS
jgi:ketosteroid isomerase-like protein